MIRKKSKQKSREVFRSVVIIILLIVMTISVSITVTTPTAKAQEEDAIEIYDWYDLDSVRDNKTADYILMNDLDEDTAGYDELASPDANDGGGWIPIARYNEDWNITEFQGNFYGQGYEIRDLYIHREEVDGEGYIGGLFGEIDNNVIKNLGLVDANITVYHTEYGSSGGIATTAYENAVIKNCYVSGNISGNWIVGGIVSANYGTLKNTYSTANVFGKYNETQHIDGKEIGGLVGRFLKGNITNSYATGNVYGNTSLGELVGAVEDLQADRIIEDSFALRRENLSFIGSEEEKALEEIGRVTNVTEEHMKNIKLYTNDDFENYDSLNESWDIATVEEYDDETWHIYNYDTYPLLGEPVDDSTSTTTTSSSYIYTATESIQSIIPLIVVLFIIKIVFKSFDDIEMKNGGSKGGY